MPRYNIAPRTQAPVLRRQDPGPSNVNVSYILHSMKWGLVPHWSKFEDKTLSTTNARSENLVEGGGMWASMKGRKRCAILCQGCVSSSTSSIFSAETRHVDITSGCLRARTSCPISRSIRTED